MGFNEKQLEIVNHINGPLLCIAGPGSGKTTSIIGRVHNMVQSGISPHQILVVTFTKAAADEMKERYLAMKGAIEGPTFGTIHSICFRILRKYNPDAYTKDSVLSEADQRVFFRNEIKSLRIERTEQDTIIAGIISAISFLKNNGVKPESLKVDGMTPEQFKGIYDRYEKYKREENKIDYDDMLYITDQILSQDATTINFWRSYFSHIIIDEFQDTNILQAKILYNIAYPRNNICVVGDDDQCQPVGTKVMLADGSSKNIEDVKEGDEVKGISESFLRRYSEIQKIEKNDKRNENRIERAVSRKYNGNIITVRTKDGKESRYTPNHITYVRINKLKKEQYMLYLMRDGDNRFSAYVAPLSARESGQLPLWEEDYCRTRSNALWMLRVFESEFEALRELAKVKEQFHIAQIVRDDFGKYEDALKCLNAYDRTYEYPLMGLNVAGRNIRNCFFENGEIVEIYADNFIPEYMSCLEYIEGDDEDYAFRDSEVVCVSYADHKDNPTVVYSLKTTTGNYIADALLTHNCIYRFRGAVPAIMLNFESQFAGCKKVILNTNYRSEPQIVKTTRRLIEQNKVRFDKPLEAHKSGNATITYNSYKNRDRQIAQLVKDIKRLSVEGHPMDEIAVLYRTNNQAGQISQAFIKADIPFYTNELIINSYDHWIFGDFKKFRAVASGNCTMNEFLSIINRPNKYISRKMLPEKYDEAKIIDAAYTVPESWKREKMVEALEDWFFWVNKLADMTPGKFVATIRQQLGYDKYVKEYADTNNFDESQFVDIMNEIQTAAETFETFAEWDEFVEEELRAFKEKMKEKKREGSVMLSTMHRSKGLEWKTVFIVDCNEEITPYYKATANEDIEEERRMFYVAATRAKENLHICYIEKRNKKNMQPSRFVKEMKGNTPATVLVNPTAQQNTTLKTEFEVGTWVFHKMFGTGIIMGIDGDKIHVAFSNAGKRTLGAEWCNENLTLY